MSASDFNYQSERIIITEFSINSIENLENGVVAALKRLVGGYNLWIAVGKRREIKSIVSQLKKIIQTLPNFKYCI